MVFASDKQIFLREVPVEDFPGNVSRASHATSLAGKPKRTYSAKRSPENRSRLCVRLIKTSDHRVGLNSSNFHEHVASWTCWADKGESIHTTTSKLPVLRIGPCDRHRLRSALVSSVRSKTATINSHGFCELTSTTAWTTDKDWFTHSQWFERQSSPQLTFLGGDLLKIPPEKIRLRLFLAIS